MELKVTNILIIRLGCFEDLSHYITILGKLMKDSVSFREDVIAEEFNLRVINQINGECFLFQLLHDLPMQECETHVSYMHPSAGINFIVHSEQLCI
jgi:hypothetical protein